VPPHPSGTFPAHCNVPHASAIVFGLVQRHAALFGSHVKRAGHRTHVALFGSQLEPAAHWQDDVTPGELLSVNTMAGKEPPIAPVSPMGQAGVIKVRVFDSPVKPPV
jgi:hypothetical protein